MDFAFYQLKVFGSVFSLSSLSGLGDAHQHHDPPDMSATSLDVFWGAQELDEGTCCMIPTWRMVRDTMRLTNRMSRILCQ